jgi:hypothetical protein
LVSSAPSRITTLPFTSFIPTLVWLSRRQPLALVLHHSTQGLRQRHEEGHGRPPQSANVNPMPFDGKRLIFGGFEVLFEA